MLSQAIAVIQGKGGVGKTSTVAALAGLFTNRGYKVLTVDVDPQGNLGRDLGYFDEVDQRGDGGKGLLGALHGYPVEPIVGVRTGPEGGTLDCISAGDATETMSDMLISMEMRQAGSSLTAMQAALAPFADKYDLVFIDCPPGNPHMQRAALAAAQYVLIPTKPDDASIDGLLKVDALFAAVKSQVNPTLHLLGSFLFAVDMQAKLVQRDAHRAIADCLGDESKVFDTVIRNAIGAAQDCRRLGLLPHELEAKLPEARKARFEQLRARRTDGGGRHRADDSGRISGSAAGLAADWQDLAREVVAGIWAHRGQEVPA